MTWFHFINCAILAFAPYFIVYYATKLYEFRAFLVSIWGILGYIATQAAKMLILATLLPSGSDIEWDLSHEIVKSAAGLFDLVGMLLFLSFQLSAGAGDVKILGFGLGWSAAESLITRLFPLFLGARSLEFDWANLEMALMANVSILIYLSYSTIAWLWGRRRHDKRRIPLLFMTIAAYPVFLFLNSLLRSSNLGWYFTVAWEAVFALGIASVAKYFHSTWGKKVV